MRKWRIFCLLLLLAVVLAGCGGKLEPVPEIYFHTDGRTGVASTVNTVDGTLEQNGVVYNFSVEGSGDNYVISIRYPDGSVYEENCEDGMIFGGYLDYKYPGAEYAQGDALAEVLRDAVPQKKEVQWGKKLLTSCFCLVIGVAILLFPDLTWYFRYGWASQNAEPSDLYYATQRVLAILLIILAVLAFLIL